MPSIASPARDVNDTETGDWSSRNNVARTFKYRAFKNSNEINCLIEWNTCVELQFTPEERAHAVSQT